MRDDIRALKYRQIKFALEKTHGNIRQAARWLGANPTNVARWMCEVGLVDYGRALRRRRDWWIASSVGRALAFGLVVVVAAQALM